MIIHHEEHEGLVGAGFKPALSAKERGFSNPREYADKNVRAPLSSEPFVLLSVIIYAACANLLCSRSEGRPAGRPYIPFANFAFPIALSFVEGCG